MKNSKYACPSCGCSSKWAMISITDNKGGFPEHTYMISPLLYEYEYEDGLLLINHENDIDYFSIAILRYVDDFDLCLACNTVFS